MLRRPWREPQPCQQRHHVAQESRTRYSRDVASQTFGLKTASARARPQAFRPRGLDEIKRMFKLLELVRSSVENRALEKTMDATDAPHSYRGERTSAGRHELGDLVWNPLPPGGDGGAYVRGGAGQGGVQLPQGEEKCRGGEEEKEEEKRETQRDRSASFDARMAAAVALSLSEPEGEQEEEKGYQEEEQEYLGGEKEYLEEEEKEKEEIREDGRDREELKRSRHHAYVLGGRESSAADVGRVGIGGSPSVAAEGACPGRGVSPGSGDVVFRGVDGKRYVGMVEFEGMHARLVAAIEKLRVAEEKEKELAGILLYLESRLNSLEGELVAPAATVFSAGNTGPALRGFQDSSRGGRGRGVGMQVSGGTRAAAAAAAVAPVEGSGSVDRVRSGGSEGLYDSERGSPQVRRKQRLDGGARNSSPPEGLSGASPAPPSPPELAATASISGDTPSSKMPEGLSGIGVSSSSQAVPVALPTCKGSSQLIEFSAMTSPTLSSAKDGVRTTGAAPSDSSRRQTCADEAGKDLLGIGDSPGRFEGEAVAATPSASALNATAAAFTSAGVAISAGGGDAALRPPPACGDTPYLTSATNAAVRVGDKVATLRPQQELGAALALPPLAHMGTIFSASGKDDVGVCRPPPGFGPMPQPPQSSPPRGSGSPSGAGTVPSLGQEQTVGSPDALFGIDSAPIAPENMLASSNYVTASGGREATAMLPDGVGCFGSVSGLANLDEREVTLGREIGEGGCAVVYQLEVKGSDRKRAVAEYTGGAGLVVKVVREGGSRQQKRSMMRELGVVKRMPSNCHLNIINIISISEDKLSMVMPAATCDLRRLLDEKDVLSSMSFAERMRMFAGAARGLHYLHSELGLTHGDLKPENCLVAEGRVLKIADFGLSGSSEDTVVGLSKRYAAPELIAKFQRKEIAERTKLDPSLDRYAFGVMIPQILFMEEESRFDGEELARHRVTPKHPSFDAAHENALDLRKRLKATGSWEDQERLEDANAAIFELHVDYAAQPARMGNLRTTILDPEKWKQPEELIFQEEVTLILLSLLNKNPHRRASLDIVAGLLECPLMWCSAATVAPAGAGRDQGIDHDDDTGCRRPHLPQDVRDTIDVTIGGGLLVNPALDTPTGVWWEAPEFTSPWWDNPPHVERLVL